MQSQHKDAINKSRQKQSHRKEEEKALILMQLKDIVESWNRKKNVTIKYTVVP
jgi:hypothetical protein